jgi:hypothetical protein
MQIRNGTQTRQNDVAMRIFTAAVVISAMLTQASYSQIPPPITPPLSDDEKADIARKKADEKANDEGYKSAIKRLPDANQKVDPWGSLRTPAKSGSK